MLAEPQQTSFDLRWSMFGVPVRVHPLFWLMAAFICWPAVVGGDSEGGGSRLVYLALGIFVVFLSILIHELGHVFMGRVFGSRGHIILYSFGGLAVGSNRLHKRWQRVLVSLAGPLAQFVLLAGVIGGVWVAALAGYSVLSPETPDSVLTAFSLFVFVNLFWPVLNLLPVWPLDGGMITRELFEAASASNGTVLSLQLSLVLSGLLAGIGLYSHYVRPIRIPFIGGLGLMGGILFAMLAVGSWQALQYEQARRRDEDDWDNRYR